MPKVPNRSIHQRQKWEQDYMSRETNWSLLVSLLPVAIVLLAREFSDRIEVTPRQWKIIHGGGYFALQTARAGVDIVTRVCYCRESTFVFFLLKLWQFGIFSAPRAGFWNYIDISMSSLATNDVPMYGLLKSRIISGLQLLVFIKMGS